jgi:menaquinone-dependent protoporphyrinogen IX oxidase
VGHADRTHFALPPAGVDLIGAGPKVCDYAGGPHREGAEIMPSICILYATREGQTRRIAEHIAAELRWRGVAVTVTNVRDHTARNSLNTFTAAILAASVHAGRHEPEMLQFVKEHRGELECLPTAFLSVTLSEAGAERSDATPEERAQFVADVQKVLDRFFAETGWHLLFVQ